ncbi:UvrB domain 3-containing protein [Schaalia sp. JY-X159]|uniref:type I restriction enzyme subunit R domain-containing protein n=1 Tax=Schaalia sp. JY-X159 TaxID=2758575 RepID=UPI0037D9ED0C
MRAHGLIQAYSRTNRILNSVKTYGNIVAFRNLEDETNAALELFGNKDAKGIVLLKPFSDYYVEYEKLVGDLLGALRTSGTDITSVLPPVPRFSRGGQHGVTKRRVIERLTGFFERFLGLV